jgi:hypothetical protein
MLNWKEIPAKEKLKIKNNIEKYKMILEKIPFEVYYAANDFINQNLFGSIRQEQKLLKKISDNFYNIIAPKHGLKFIDANGKPLQLFSDP